MKYDIYPKNKLLVLQKVESKSKTDILVPDNYKKQEKFGTYTIVRTDLDSIYSNYKGSIVVMLESMVDEVSVFGQKFLMAPENAVMGLLTEGE